MHRVHLTYQCLTNLSLCMFISNKSTIHVNVQAIDTWYNVTTKCTPRGLLAGATCTSSLQCDSTLSLTCDPTAQVCTCNAN